MNNLNIHHLFNIDVSEVTTLEDTTNKEFSSWREITFTCLDEGKEEQFKVCLFSNPSSSIYRTINALQLTINDENKVIKKGNNS
tara:strand:+ start:1263 stop:1514 length:252 start_codon:yes stop_codon:yes gene_type:complete